MTDAPDKTPLTEDAEQYLEMVLGSLSKTLRSLLRMVYAGGRTAVLRELAAGRTIDEATAATEAAVKAVYMPQTTPPARKPARVGRAAMATTAAVAR